MGRMGGLAGRYLGAGLPLNSWVSIVIVDYTSPALCTPITRLPLIGDATYRHYATQPITSEIQVSYFTIYHFKREF